MRLGDSRILAATSSHSATQNIRLIRCVTFVPVIQTWISTRSEFQTSAHFSGLLSSIKIVALSRRHRLLFGAVGELGYYGCFQIVIDPQPQLPPTSKSSSYTLELTTPYTRN